jgi:hypothetical protein
MTGSDFEPTDLEIREEARLQQVAKKAAEKAKHLEVLEMNQFSPPIHLHPSMHHIFIYNIINAHVCLGTSK